MLFYDNTQAVQTFYIRPFFYKSYGFEAALRQGLKPLYFSPCLLQFWSSQLVKVINCWTFDSSSLLKSKQKLYAFLKDQKSFQLATTL